jgi:antirestriction protein ArdC
MEELIAELGAAFLCASLNITLDPRPDHAAYIDSWLKVLKSDKKAVFTAASQASQAVDYLYGLQPAMNAEAA